MDISDAPPLDWRILNDETHIASNDGQLTRPAAAVESTRSQGRVTWAAVAPARALDRAS
jgi:hypothetical protein